jgi:hypothetical protein
MTLNTPHLGTFEKKSFHSEVRTYYLFLRLREKRRINRAVIVLSCRKCPIPFLNYGDQGVRQRLRNQRWTSVNYLTYANVYYVNLIPTSTVSERKFYSAQTVNET